MEDLKLIIIKKKQDNLKKEEPIPIWKAQYESSLIAFRSKVSADESLD